MSVTRGQVRYWRARYIREAREAREARAAYLAALVRGRVLRDIYIRLREGRLEYLAQKERVFGKGGLRDAYLARKSAAARSKRTYKEKKEAFFSGRGEPPKIVRSGLNPDNVFGPLGPVQVVTGHHTAAPTDRSDEDALRLARQFDGHHRAQGWGGIGYHFMLARSGSIILLRPVSSKGAHVGGHNTGNVGIVCNGTTGDRPTEAQADSLAWLLRNAHTSAMPASHRVDLRGLKVRGHNDWAGHGSNACPGTHKRMYLSRGESR